MQHLAEAVAQGAREISGVQAVLRTAAEATRGDLQVADALIVGSPNWSGVSGGMKTWLDTQGDLWEEGTLAGRVGAAFAAGRGRHSGLEFTLLALLHWMLACGMVVVGLPWSDTMRLSGSYYGATCVGAITEEDLKQARALGARVADLTVKLRTNVSSR
ncbi:MAG: NAD(P)H-dependent oxidoreductase [Chloroflexi bacterium]|nr:NAD(P)H-dependent oxidoreductase [Chloroflexota bacterium]